MHRGDNWAGTEKLAVSKSEGKFAPSPPVQLTTNAGLKTL